MPDRSKIWLEANSTLHAIRSESAGLEGWFDDEGGRGHLELPVGELRSGNPLYDREMRRRIHARRYPTISGELTSVQPSRADGQYRAAGEITFRGVTREVSGDITVSAEGDRAIRVTGEQTFDIREFDMAPPKIVVLQVEPFVSVRIDVRAERQED